jgi:hypothetical protein
MTTSSAPGSVNELIHFIGEAVKDRYTRTGQTMNGAALATLIRKKYPAFSYEQLGLMRLGDAIAQAQRDGIVTRRTGIKHLEVSPGPALLPEAVEQRPTYSGRRYVRPDLWKAMLLFRPDQGHFLDRTTGRIVTLQVPVDDPDWSRTREENPSYVPIRPISVEVQKEWMRHYVETAKLDGVAAPIDDEWWWRAFPAWLQAQQPDQLRSWLAFRASQVIDYIQKWTEENNLPSEAVFCQPTRAEDPCPPGLASAARHAPTGPPASDAALRNALLAVVSELPTHELLDLRVPLRSILRHFRPI